LEYERETAEREAAQKDNVAMKIKIWGEALRIAITNMPTEPVEFISWFISLERFFTQLQVPSELKMILMHSDAPVS